MSLVSLSFSLCCLFYCVSLPGVFCLFFVFFFQAEDGIRDLVRSRGLGDVYKRQVPSSATAGEARIQEPVWKVHITSPVELTLYNLPSSDPTYITPSSLMTGDCLLYTSDAADDLLCVDLGGRRIIKKKTKKKKHKTKII